MVETNILKRVKAESVNQEVIFIEFHEAGSGLMWKKACGWREKEGNTQMIANLTSFSS